MFEKIKASAVYKRLKLCMKSFLNFLLKFFRDWSLHLAGMLAYSLLIAIVPMAVATLGIVGLVLQASPATQTQFANAISGIISNGSATQSATNQVII